MPTEERFLVTGALGCIGAWTVKRLIDENVPVWTYDLGSSQHRLKLIMDDAALAKINFVSGDITEFSAFEKVVADNGITHIIHLAALQVPFVRADPVLGSKVNVVGTTVVFETARRHSQQVKSVTYASSVAIHPAPGRPQGEIPNLYGVFKAANEGTARLYWQDWGVRSIGMRPHTVYGPGRDQGMTSLPSKAMLAAAAGRPYQITFSGKLVYQYADDVARVFIQAARTSYDGAPVFDLDGIPATVEEVISAIDDAAPDMKGKITFTPPPLAVVENVDSSVSDSVLGKIAWTSLKEGAKRSVEGFKKAIAAGTVDVERVLS